MRTNIESGAEPNAGAASGVAPAAASGRASTPSTRDARPVGRLRWRVVDIVTAAVVAVASGLVFMLWDVVGVPWLVSMDALTPGLGGLASGPWFIGGLLGAIIVRKPGAALFVEVVGAIVEMLLGSQFSITAVYAGLLQGLAAELVFAVFAYRRFGLGVSVLAGIASAAGFFVFGLLNDGNAEKGLEYLAIYGGALVVSGAVLAGALSWLAVRALARTGALSRFAAGRDAERIG